MTKQPSEKIDEFVKIVMNSDESDVNIPFWAPSEGDVVVGRITNVSRLADEFGERDVYTIYDELIDSYVNVTANTMLHNRFKALGVTVGDRVGIKYLGKKKGKNKREYNLYAVFVDEKDRATPKAALPNSHNGEDEESPF